MRGAGAYTWSNTSVKGGLICGGLYAEGREELGL